MASNIGVSSHEDHHDKHQNYHSEEADSHLFELWVSAESTPVKNYHCKLTRDQTADRSRGADGRLGVACTTKNVSEDSRYDVGHCSEPEANHGLQPGAKDNLCKHVHNIVAEARMQ